MSYFFLNFSLKFFTDLFLDTTRGKLLEHGKDEVFKSTNASPVDIINLQQKCIIESYANYTKRKCKISSWKNFSQVELLCLAFPCDVYYTMDKEIYDHKSDIFIKKENFVVLANSPKNSHSTSK